MKTILVVLLKMNIKGERNRGEKFWSTFSLSMAQWLSVARLLEKLVIVSRS
jgi:disulfide bond formation protein DsbB